MCLCYLFSAKKCMTTSESKGRLFYKTNRFESIRITNRIDFNRELQCSIRHPAGSRVYRKSGSIKEMVQDRHIVTTHH